MTPAFLQRSDGQRVAYNQLAGTSPGVVFLHGLMSDRGGTKAMALEAHCAARGLGYVRFDMFGHGDSSGLFEDGSVTRWVEDSVTNQVIERTTVPVEVIAGDAASNLERVGIPAGVGAGLLVLGMAAD
jgi:pimeloyl-ACP methyl ester carboxylesterase